MSSLQDAIDDPLTATASLTASGGAAPLNTEPSPSEPNCRAQNQPGLEQHVLDSLLQLASGQSEETNFISASHPPWSAAEVTGSEPAYHSLLAVTSSSDQVWPSDLTTSRQTTNEETATWLDNNEFEDPTRTLGNLSWPLLPPVTRTTDEVNWSPAADIIDHREFGHGGGLPRRRSRYRFVHSEQRAIPISIPTSPVSQGLDPMQRWKESPPQDEPASMTAIFDALRTDRSVVQTDGCRDEPTYTRTNSGTSVGSGESSSSMQSASSTWSAASEASRGRRAGFGPLGRNRQGRVGKKRSVKPVANDNRPFKCTFCCDSFKTKYDWARHEKSRHLNLESWVCAPQGGSVMSTVTGRYHCAYCSAMDPSEEHLEEHNHDTCHDRPIESRSFGRKDHLVQHLRVMHKLEKLPRFDDWKAEAAEIASRCGFCDLALPSWRKRVDHLATHFRKGMTMQDWRGEHGFSPEIADQVVHALPPYLIGSESLSVVPFSATKQGTKDHFAQISSRIRGSGTCEAAEAVDSSGLEAPAPVQSSSILSSRAATSKAFTEILERHLKHFVKEHMAQGIRPTDDMLRQESRRVIYDSDDEWNQTVADNSVWLAKFWERHGLGDKNGDEYENTQPG